MENKQVSCCGEEGASGDCGCGTPGGRNWARTLLFLAIILAAVAVGVYSLRSQAGQAPATPLKGATKPAATADAGAGKAEDCSKKCDSTSKSPCCGK